MIIASQLPDIQCHFRPVCLVNKGNGTEDDRESAYLAFPTMTRSQPGVIDGHLLQNGPRQAWFLLFRDRRSAELALRQPAIARLRMDPSRGNIFVEQFEALERPAEIEQPTREASLLVAEQPTAVAH